MPTNSTRKQLLDRIKTSSFPGSIIDVFKAADQGVDLISQFEQEQQQQMQQQPPQQQGQGMEVANTPEQQEVGLREQHAMGNTDASMAFPNVEPNQSFNTVGMKAPINIEKIDEQGHLVESYKNVPPGIQDLPTGPYKGTIIESPAAYKRGGIRKYQTAGLRTDPQVETPSNLVPNPVRNNSSNFGFNFDCDSGAGKSCKNRSGTPFRVGITGSLSGSKGLYGQPTNLGPGWNSQGEYVENRIGTGQNFDIEGNLGGYARVDLPFGKDKNWNPMHLNLGYNRKQNFMEGTGSNNLTTKLAYSGDQFTGSPGYGGFFGNKGGSSRSGFSYGLEGNYNLNTQRVDNIGAFGRTGLMGPLGINASAGINPQTGKAKFGAGLSLKFKKGGLKKYQTAGKKEDYVNRLLPEINVSALTDTSYNKLSAQDKKLYDMFIDKETGDITQTAPFSIDGYKGELHWEDVLGMSKNSGGVTIKNKPAWNANHFGFDMDSEGDFRAHASPLTNSIHIPRFHEEYISDDNVEKRSWIDKGTKEDGSTDWKLVNKYIPRGRPMEKKKFMNNFIAELGHQDKDVSLPWKGSMIPSILSRMYRSVLLGKMPDNSNYYDEYDEEYYTHFGENSGESQVVKKNLKHPSSYIERAGDFRKTNNNAYKKGYKNWGNMIINNFKSTFRPSIYKDGGLKKYQTAGIKEGYDKDGNRLYNYSFKDGVATYITEKEYHDALIQYQKNQAIIQNMHNERQGMGSIEDQQLMHDLSRKYNTSLEGTDRTEVYGSQSSWSNWDKMQSKIEQLNTEAGYEKYTYTQFEGDSKYSIVNPTRFKGDKEIFKDADRMERDYDLEWAISNGYYPNMDNPNWRSENDYRETNTLPQYTAWDDYASSVYITSPDQANRYSDADGNISYRMLQHANKEVELAMNNNEIGSRTNENGEIEYYYKSGYDFTPTQDDGKYRDGQSGDGQGELYTFPYTSAEGGIIPAYGKPVDRETLSNPDNFLTTPILPALPQLDEATMALLNGKGFVSGPSDTTLSGSGSGTGIYNPYNSGDIMNSKVSNVSQEDLDRMVKEKYLIATPYKGGRGQSHFGSLGPPTENFSTQYTLNPDYKKGGLRKLKKRKARLS